jgi:hypothetical protein
LFIVTAVKTSHLTMLISMEQWLIGDERERVEPGSPATASITSLTVIHLRKATTWLAL